MTMIRRSNRNRPIDQAIAHARRALALATRHTAQALAMVAAVLVLAGCETNPTTGRSQLLAFDIGQEVAIGQEAKPQMLQEFGGEVAREDLRAYIEEVGQRLVSTVGMDDPRMAQLPWEFTLLDSDVVNAFALPGGKVFMSRGLAQQMTNEAQLAAVLGHEIGHVTARHTSERIGRGQATAAGVGLLGVLLGESGAGGATDLLNSGAQLWLLGYDRNQEIEADALGMRYMERVGYDPIGTRQVMEILARESRAGREPEFFSTHPHPETRIARIDDLLRTQYAHTRDNPAFRTGEAEFRARFLNKLAEAYPPNRPEDPRTRAFALTRTCTCPDHAHRDE